MIQEEIQKYADELAQQYFPNEHNIWARENIEAKFVSEACVRMAKYVEQELIKKTCKYLETNFGIELCMAFGDKFIDKLRKAMEE